MPLRKLIDTSAFTPEVLAIVYEAFDLAWAEIAPRYGGGAEHLVFSREALARAVLAAAERGVEDPIALKNAALETFIRMNRMEG